MPKESRRKAGSVASVTVVLTALTLAYGVPARAQMASKTVVEPAHFHHVHLNVTDPAETIAFYEKFFGSSSVKYRGVSDALFTEKSFILLSRVPDQPPTHLRSSLWHIGWAGIDGPQEFEWRTSEGIAVHTPLTELGPNHYMYFYGPSREVIEVYTGSKNHRFEHVHLLVTDLDGAIQWFAEHLGLTPRWPSARPYRSGTSINVIRVGNVNLIVFGIPESHAERPAWFPPELGDPPEATDGSAIDHLAFSYADIAPVFERMKDAGVEIVRPVAKNDEYGITSFFVRGPDELLIEIIQERHIPEGIWETGR